MRPWTSATLTLHHHTSSTVSALTETTHVFAFNKYYFCESINESINTGPPPEPDDALSWKGSFPAWHTE